MRTRFVALSVVALSTLTIAGCSPDDTAQQGPPPAPASPVGQERPATTELPAATAEAAMTEGNLDSAAGLVWSIPDSWHAEAPRPMRVATYSTPAAAGDTDPGEVAVFYFGPTEGGTVEANVDRWFGQFDQEDGRPTGEIAERESLEIAGMPVTIVKASGAYNAAAGPMAPRADIRPGYALIGAIAEGPEGAVFFKFTGPEQTVAKEAGRFQSMIESLQQP